MAILVTFVGKATECSGKNLLELFLPVLGNAFVFLLSLIFINCIGFGLLISTILWAIVNKVRLEIWHTHTNTRARTLVLGIDYVEFQEECKSGEHNLLLALVDE